MIKREKFQKIFDKTLFQCIEHIIGKKTYKELEGLEIIYENEMKELNEEDEYKDKLNDIYMVERNRPSSKLKIYDIFYFK